MATRWGSRVDVIDPWSLKRVGAFRLFPKSLRKILVFVLIAEKFDCNCKQDGFSTEVRASFQGKNTVQCLRNIKTDYEQLSNPDLLHNQSCIGGEWKDAKSGKRFEVVGRYISSI